MAVGVATAAHEGVCFRAYFATGFACVFVAVLISIIADDGARAARAAGRSVGGGACCVTVRAMRCVGVGVDFAAVFGFSVAISPCSRAASGFEINLTATVVADPSDGVSGIADLAASAAVE